MLLFRGVLVGICLGRLKVCVPVWKAVEQILIYSWVDYLIPMLEGMEVERETWKYLNIGIGANDIVS
jgi:hypothetical protein